MAKGSYVKAGARRLVLAALDELLAAREGLTGREDKEVNHEIKRLKFRLERDVRSLSGNRDYAVKGRAQ